MFYFIPHFDIFLAYFFTVPILYKQDEFLLVYKTVRDYIETASENVYYYQWQLTLRSQSTTSEDVI